MKNFYKNLIIIPAILLALSAQAIGPEAGALTLTVAPQYPAAGENFTVKARSFTFDPLRANFQWLLNGKLVASGKGLSEQNFTAAKLGSAMTITSIASLADGTSYETKITVSIADIDIIVRPLTYTPLFYRGSSFASPGSTVEIYAQPHLFSGSSKLSSKSLIYEWFLNGNKSSSQSGEGKNKFTLTTADAGDVSYDVRLRVSSAGGSVSAQKNVRVKTQSPEVLFYEINTLTGRKNLAYNLFPLPSGNSLSILAEPYFFNLSSLGRAIVSWSTNGGVIESATENPKILEVSAPENSVSSTNFGFSIEDNKTIYQRSEASLTINVTE